MLTISRDQARQIDRRAVEEFGLPSIVLMENAGRGVAEQLRRLEANGPIAICCGGGNNGGDGLVVARHLDAWGYDVRVLMFADPAKLQGDTKTNYHVLERSQVAIRPGNLADFERDVGGCNWIMDALLGTGARGEPRPPLDRLIELINSRPTPILAIDLPSGLDCDSGRPASKTIRAAHTCTFVAPKPGFGVPGAERFTGEVHVVDIGVPRKLIEEILGRALE